jgi:hypothetical protein
MCTDALVVLDASELRITDVANTTPFPSELKL